MGHELDSGKKRKMGIAGNIDSVKKLILSQENAAKRTFLPQAVTVKQWTNCYVGLQETAVL